MKDKREVTLSRREFAQRAAMLSATVSLIPCEVIPAQTPATPPQTPANAPKLSASGQAEADSRYQQVLSLYSDRLDDSQKANIKQMCAQLQPALERVRNFKLDNSDAPALFLKPLVERDKKPQAPAKPAATPAPKH